MVNQKIIPINEIKQTLDHQRNQGKKIVQCHGVFDLIHPGHIKHLEAAKKFGDLLVISITCDEFVNKGPGRPIFNETIRAETLAALETVDFVTINYAPTAVPALEIIQPDFYVKGQDYKDAAEDLTGEILNEKRAAEKNGGQLVFTDEIQFSSSNLINRFIPDEDQNLADYMQNLRKLITFDRLKELFKRIESLRVMVIGDIILDEYQFVKALGKASKSATITAKLLDRELYAGGILAVANHVADFVSEVSLITCYGLNQEGNYFSFIRDHLHKNVKLHAVQVNSRPTTLKRRFLDPIFKQKMFEVIEIDDSPLTNDIKNLLMHEIQQNLSRHDMIIVTDFGHGILDQELIHFICKQDKYLCVNAQTNSANIGFNFITQYPRCDYFSIDLEEAQLAMHDKVSSVPTLHRHLMKKLNAGAGAITLGSKGSLVGNLEKTAAVPALSREIVDTIGAGDAYLAITSLMAKIGANVEEIAFVGNAVGAMASKILGNKSSIQKTPLLKFLKTLLA